MRFQKREKVIPDSLFTRQRQFEYRYIDDSILEEEKKSVKEIVDVVLVEKKKIVCTKVSYPSERRAKEVINFLKKWRWRNHMPKRAYKCPNCWLYHLTSHSWYAIDK